MHTVKKKMLSFGSAGEACHSHHLVRPSHVALLIFYDIQIRSIAIQNGQWRQSSITLSFFSRFLYLWARARVSAGTVSDIYISVGPGENNFPTTPAQASPVIMLVLVAWYEACRSKSYYTSFIYMNIQSEDYVNANIFQNMNVKVVTN